MDLEKTLKELSQHEKKVLLTLKQLKGKASPADIFSAGNFNQEVEVMNAASWLQSKKLVTVEEHLKTTYSLGKEGEIYVEKGLPEKRALKVIHNKKGKATLRELSSILDNEEVPIAIGWLKRNGWATITKETNDTVLTLTAAGKKAVTETTSEERILQQLHKEHTVVLDKKDVVSLLSRKNLIKEKESISSTIVLTEHGKKILDKGIILTDEISQITSAVIKSGEWKKKAIRPYDIHAFAPATYGGKAHPLVDLITKIRTIFIEMGFEEIQGNFVESSFWNMDMLFIPQDHPAREMQDTLYCKTPKKIVIKEKDLIDKIAQVHETGGNTSSTGWGYTFAKDMVKKPLLRTHTTVNTIRHLYEHPQPPCKVFSLGRVFRKENIDATHLPEFYQIEGIVHEEGTTFKQLIGVLKEFYCRMGFEKIRFRPGYFPYTEPSMEVDVFWNNQWMELGGSGIFRPEVTEPIGIKNPVLAWGLGLERLAMLKFELTDIRDLYISDLEWLRTISLL